MSNKISNKNVENDSVIAHKFAVMQQQIYEKDKRIKELEEENHKILENSADVIRDMIPKQKVKDELSNLRNMFKATTEGILQEYTVEEIIIKINTLEEILEDK